MSLRRNLILRFQRTPRLRRKTSALWLRPAAGAAFTRAAPA
jgi:hypothetical protein